MLRNKHISTSSDKRTSYSQVDGIRMVEIHKSELIPLFNRPNIAASTDSMKLLHEDLNQKKQTMREWHRHNKVMNANAHASTFTKKDISFDLSLNNRVALNNNFKRLRQPRGRAQTIDPISIITDNKATESSLNTKNNRYIEVTYNNTQNDSIPNRNNSRSTECKKVKNPQGYLSTRESKFDYTKVNTAFNYKNKIGYQSKNLISTDSKINLSNERIDLLISEESKTYKCSKSCYRDIIKKDQLNKKLFPALDEFCNMKTMKEKQKNLSKYNLYELEKMLEYLTEDLPNWLNIVDQMEYYIISLKKILTLRHENQYTKFMTTNLDDTFDSKKDSENFVSGGFRRKLPNNDDLDIQFNETLESKFNNYSLAFLDKTKIFDKSHLSAKHGPICPFNSNLESFLCTLGWYYKKVARTSQEICVDKVEINKTNLLVNSILMCEKNSKINDVELEIGGKIVDTESDGEETIIINQGGKNIVLKTQEDSPSVKKSRTIEKKAKNKRLFPMNPEFIARKMKMDITFKKLDTRCKDAVFYGENLPSFTEFQIKRKLWV